jgi:hypothetical protein
MTKEEVGRMILNDITLIEYRTEDNLSYFLQSGIVGFYASSAELADLYALLSYYYNIDGINNTIISLKDSANDWMENDHELAV